MKLYHRIYGSGPPLVILHGLFGSSDNWASIAKHLSDTFTVILPDQRNHGMSPHSAIHDYDHMRDDLAELVNDLGLESFFLAGHSMGGKTAMSYAMNWPEKLLGLIVADISPFRGDDRNGSEYSYYAGILSAMLKLDLNNITSREMAESELEKSGLPERVRGFILKNLKRDGGRYEWKLNAPSLLKNLENIMKPMVRNSASAWPVTGFPVIFMGGSRSDYLPPEDFPDILRLFPAAEFVTIPDAGHWVHADNPGEVIRIIRTLLT